MECEDCETDPETWPKKLEEIEFNCREVFSLQELTTDAVDRYLYKLYEARDNSTFSNLAYLECYTKK